MLGATCTGTQPAPGTTQYHRTSLQWKAPTFGAVYGYRVYRVTGSAVTAASTRVLIGTTAAATTTFVDGEELPDGVPFTYFVTAEFSDESPRTVSGASNFATITAVNAAPVAVANAYSTTQGNALTINAPGVLGNDTDSDSPSTSLRVVLPVASGPANGSLSPGANGSFVYTPNPGFFGTDSFTYAANDGTWGPAPGVPMSANSSAATVTITVTQIITPPPGNSAPVCTAIQATVTTGGSVTLRATCSDADAADTVRVTAVGPATLGTTVLLADGRFTYTVSSPRVGPDAFTYTVTDGRASVTGQVNVRVQYGFTNVENLPPTNGKTFNRGGTVPLKWQWSDAAGVALDSSAAQPFVKAYACSTAGKLPAAYPIGVFDLARPGSGNTFGLPTKKNGYTWQFNWKLTYTVETNGQVKTYDLPAGTYVVSVGSALTGQIDPVSSQTCADGKVLSGAVITLK